MRNERPPALHGTLLRELSAGSKANAVDSWPILTADWADHPDDLRKNLQAQENKWEEDCRFFTCLFMPNASASYFRPSVHDRAFRVHIRAETLLPHKSSGSEPEGSAELRYRACPSIPAA